MHVSYVTCMLLTRPILYLFISSPNENVLSEHTYHQAQEYVAAGSPLVSCKNAVSRLRACLLREAFRTPSWAETDFTEL